MEMQKCKYREFAKKQIEYLVGKEVRSYVVGYGPNPPSRNRIFNLHQVYFDLSFI